MGGICLARLIASLEEIIDEDKVPQTEEEVREFILKLLIDNGTHFDVVIGADRKGIRILKEVIASCPGAITCKVMSDNQIEPEALKGARVLVFDDSIHTGNKVLTILGEIEKQAPKSMTIACLLVNEDGKRYIEGSYPGIEIHSCKLIFKRYADQADMYVTWEMPFLSRQGNKDNPDYPALKLETSDHDIDGIIRSMTEILVMIAPPKEEGLYEMSNSPKSRSITIEAEAGSVIIPKPYDSISEHDCTKIRCSVVDYGAKVEVTVMPIINPRFDSDNCHIDATAPDKCLYKLLKAKKSDFCCRMCIPVLVNQAFVTNNGGIILEKLQGKGVLINKYWLELPHLGRFRR